MTTDQVVKLLKIDRSTLWRWRKAKKVPGPARILPRRREQCWTLAEVEAVRQARARNVRKPGNPGTPRKPYKTVDVARIARLRAAGSSWKRVGTDLGCAPQTAKRASLRAGKLTPNTVQC